MSLDTFMKGVLDVMTPIITPDWGKLIVLIPALLTLIVVAYLAITAFRWVNLYRAAPASPRATSAAGRVLAAPTGPTSPNQIKAPTPPKAAIAPKARASAPTASPAATPTPPEASAAPMPAPETKPPKAAAAPRGDATAAKPKAAKASTGSTEKKHKRFWER